MRRFTSLAVVCGVMILASVASVQAADWTALGERLVDYRSNPVVVTIKNEAAVKAIKLQVKDEAMEITKLTVTTADGQSFDVTVDKFLARGKETKEFEVASGPKQLSKVEVHFRGGNADRRLARVIVLGQS